MSVLTLLCQRVRSACTEHVQDTFWRTVADSLYLHFILSRVLQHKTNVSHGRIGREEEGTSPNTLELEALFDALEMVRRDEDLV